MAKGTFKIQGEKFVCLWKGKKSRAKIASELAVSTSSITQWSRPGVWGVNIEKAESWPPSIREAIQAEGGEVNGQPLIRVDEYPTKKDLLAAVAKAWDDRQVKKAAKKQ
jgi:hypothetical protein